MAGQAVALAVTGDAGLEALAGGRPVGEEEALLRIMETTPKLALGREPGLLVAVGAERIRIVALSA